MADEGASITHTVFRVLQVLTLITAWSLMAAIVSWYNENTVKQPGGVLALFIILILSSVWAFCILIATARARNTALWITFWDIVASMFCHLNFLPYSPTMLTSTVIALIVGVATTANIANYQCNAVKSNQQQTIYIVDGRQVSSNSVQQGDNDDDDIWDQSDYCNLLKAAWGLAIANIIMFFITAILAAVIYKQNQRPREETTIYVDERSPAPVVHEKIYTNDYPRRPRRSHHSSRSTHSHRSRPRSRSYIVDDAV